MPTSDFDALDQFVALSKCLAGISGEDSHGKPVHPRLVKRVAATMDALLDHINRDNDFALPDSTGNSGPCRCAAHQERNLNYTVPGDLSDEALDQLYGTGKPVNGTVVAREGVDVKPETYDLKADLTKACTELVSWVQWLCRKHGWQEVKINIKPDGQVCPMIFLPKNSTNSKAALAAADELRSIFGIEVTKSPRM